MLAVTHLSKSGGTKAMYRAMGSLAFAAAARSVWSFMKDQDDPERRLFLPTKLNLGREPDGLAYRIQDGHVVWETDPVAMHADDGFAAEAAAIAKSARSGRTSQKDQAADWLLQRLGDTTTTFSHGDDESLLDHYAVVQLRGAALCGSKLPNGWGLFDVHGNVSEWCHDWYGLFGREEALRDPLGPAHGSNRTLHGGSFYDLARVASSAHRFAYSPSYRNAFYRGFRVARTYP